MQTTKLSMLIMIDENKTHLRLDYHKANGTEYTMKIKPENLVNTITRISQYAERSGMTGEVIQITKLYTMLVWK